MPSPFETALGKLASLLGDDTPEATAYGVKNALAGYPGVEKVKNALNPDPQVTNRASMLPIGNYDDGSVGLAIPQSLIDAKEAFGRGEHHSRSQPRGEGGRFVAKDSFDGRLAALDKILVDLDGDGTPDAVMDAPQAPRNALMAQASPSDRLKERGYLDKLPPTASQEGAWGPQQRQAIESYMRPRINALTGIGMPPDEAARMIREMPDVESEWQSLGRQGQTDPMLQDEIRKLLEDVR